MIVTVRNAVIAHAIVVFIIVDPFIDTKAP